MITLNPLADLGNWRNYTSPQHNIIGYIPSWRQSEGFDYSNQLIYQNITHGIIAFLEFDPNNPAAFSADSINKVSAIIGKVVTAGHAAGARIMIALGGRTTTDSNP